MLYFRYTKSEKLVLLLGSVRPVIPISLLIFLIVKSRYVAVTNWGMKKTLDKILNWDLL